MTFTQLSKKFALASTTILALSALSGLSNVRVTAADTQDQVSNGEVKIYAQSAAGNTSTTTNNDGSDTDTGVTNNQSTGQAGNQGTTQNNGTTQSVTGMTMSNVTFSATKYAGSGVPTGTTDAAFTGATVTATSNASGLADFTGLTDGYYLFHQVTTVNGITTVKDFIVQVNTTDSQAGTVNVYPKLDMSSSAGLADTATTNASDNFNGKTPNDFLSAGTLTGTGAKTDQTLSGTGSTIGGTQGDNDYTWSANSDDQNTTTAAGNNIVNWNVNSVFDSSQTSDGSTTGTVSVTGTYVVTDKLPTNLVDISNVNNNSVIVNVTDATGKAVGTLTAGTDYSVTTAADGTVTVTLTAKGQTDTAALLNGKDGALNIVIPTTVLPNAVGSAKDSATTSITNAYGADLSTTTPVSSTLNVGGLDFQKVDATSNAPLAGAMFVLVQAKDYASAQALVEANASYFNNSAQTGNPSTMSNADAAFVTGAPDATNAPAEANGDTNKSTIAMTTTNADGIAAFSGLNLVDDNTDTTNQQNYFAVEVMAPKGYTLPSATNGANVFSAGGLKATTTAFNLTSSVDSNTITNTKPFDLPFTGGAGIGAILVIATVAGVSALVIRRKKNNDEEVIVK